MDDRKLIFGALTWSVGILMLAYGYRVLITDPRYVRTNPTMTLPVETTTISGHNEWVSGQWIGSR